MVIIASDGEFIVDIPRDREGVFELNVAKKYENNKDKYAKGMATHDIMTDIIDCKISREENT